METINNLTYEIQIDYINNSGKNVTILKRIQDNGLETILYQIGDIAVTEETINGRVLSGHFECKDTFCGYRYDYSKNTSDYLTTSNKAISLDQTVSLINSAKMSSDFLAAKMVFSALNRNDYKLFTLKKGAVDLTKSISAGDENHKIYSYSELVHLLKDEQSESCSEESREYSYEFGDKFVTATPSNKKECESLNLKMQELIEVFKQNPNNYKSLISAKEKVLPQESSVEISEKN